MIRQYIWKEGNRVGLLFAERQGADLVVGYSLLHPNDEKEIRAYNHKVKRANAESHYQNNLLKNAGQEATHPVEKYRPIFDKNKAFEIAQKNATNSLSVWDQHPKVQSVLHNFASQAHWKLGGKFSFAK